MGPPALKAGVYQSIKIKIFFIFLSILIAVHLPNTTKSKFAANELEIFLLKNYSIIILFSKI